MASAAPFTARRRVIALAAAAVFATLGAAANGGGGAHAAAVLQVPADYATIADAIAAASAGDEIELAPGVYAESPTVSKPLTIRGAEGATIAGSLSLAAPAVIRGLTIEYGGTGRALEVGSAAVGSIIEDNAFSGEGAPDMGVFVNNVAGTAESPTIIRDNTFHGFVSPGGGAIVTSFPATAYVEITGNTIDNGSVPGGVGVNLRDGSSHVTISGNAFASLANGIVEVSTGLYGNRVATDVAIVGNTFTTTVSAGVYLGPNQRDVTIAGNTFTGIGTSALHVSYYSSDVNVIEPLDGIRFTGNAIQSAAAGVRVLDGVRLAREGAVTSAENSYGTISSGVAVASEAVDQPAVVSYHDELGAARTTGNVVVIPPPSPDAPPTETPSVPAGGPDTDPAPFAGAEVLPAASTTSQASGDAASRTITMNLGPDYANQWFYVTLYSDPTVIGWVWFGPGGTATFPLPDALPAGTHTVALIDASGAVVAYVSGVSVAALLAATGLDPAQGWLVGTFGATIGLWGLVALLVVATRRRARPRG